MAGLSARSSSEPKCCGCPRRPQCRPTRIHAHGAHAVPATPHGNKLPLNLFFMQVAGDAPAESVRRDVLYHLPCRALVQWQRRQQQLLKPLPALRSRVLSAYVRTKNRRLTCFPQHRKMPTGHCRRRQSRRQRTVHPAHVVTKTTPLRRRREGQHVPSLPLIAMSVRHQAV